MFYLPKKIETIINTLSQKGYDAYIVGGCVRDMLLSIEPSDFDVTTSAPPQVIQNSFEQTVPTGIEHGTVTVIIDKEPFEVTTFRTDGTYSDCRRPDHVQFVSSLHEDLRRRDFTVNAMAYNKKEGLCDYFGGQQDLETKTLRTVGNPNLRFREDALRILRLFRFSSTLLFSIEKDTLVAALECSNLLENVSSERIFTELLKLLCGHNPEAIEPLTKTGSLEFIGINHSDELNQIALLNKSPMLAFFTFIYLTGGNFDKVLKNLKVPNLYKEYANTVNKLLSFQVPETKSDIKNMLNISSFDTMKDYFVFCKTINKSGTEYAENLLFEIIKNHEPYRIKDLDLNGNDLQSVGVSGKDIGKTLAYLRNLVVSSPHLNQKAKLLEKAQQYNRN